ncbi:MAG: DUF4386 domain-containing protein [Actinomycetota bacterium]
MTTLASHSPVAPLDSALEPPPTEVSPRTAAVVAGVSYVVLFALGILANFVVREGLVVADDAATTAANLAESEGLFRLGMLAFLVIFVLDIVVAWALHVVFRSTNHDLSLVAAWSRLIYTAFLGVAIVFFFQALQLLGGSSFLDAFTTEQLHAQALVALDTFNSTWLIGLVAFGLHLVLLGWIIIRSGVAPRALGVVLVVAGVAYMADTTAHTMLNNYADYEAIFVTMVAIPAVVAEGWFGLWLLLRAGRSRSTPDRNS